MLPTEFDIQRNSCHEKNDTSNFPVILRGLTETRLSTKYSRLYSILSFFIILHYRIFQQKHTENAAYTSFSYQCFLEFNFIPESIYQCIPTLEIFTKNESNFLKKVI